MLNIVISVEIMIAIIKVLSETKQICTSVVKPLVNGVEAVRQFGVNKVCCIIAFQLALI